MVTDIIEREKKE